MRNLIISILFLVFTFTLSAQRVKRVSGYIFQPEWYVGANVGVNYYMGEGVGNFIKTASLKPLGTMGRLAIGYNFSPIIGMRSMLGFTQHNWPENNLVTSFGAENLTVDLTVNLSNLKATYNLYRPFDFFVFAGTGIALRNKGVFPNSLPFGIGRAGFQGDYHLTQFIDLNLMAELNIVGDNYNNTSIETPPIDLYPALTVGISYHLR